MPDDVDGQMAVVKATLDALERIQTPGQVIVLPMRWVEPATRVNLKPPQQPPIVQYIVRHPWDLPRLLTRNPPAP